MDKQIIKEILDALKQDYKNIQYLSNEEKNEEDLMLEIIKLKSSSLQYASNELKNKKEFILEACKINPSNISYAGKDVINDKETMFSIISNYGANYVQYLGEDLKKNTEFFDKIIRKDKQAVYFFEDLKDDYNSMINAIKINPGAFLMASKNLLKNEQFCLDAIAANPNIIADIPNGFAHNPDFYKKALKNSYATWYIVDDDLKYSEDFIISILKEDSFNYIYLEEEMKRNEKIIKITLEEDSNLFDKIPQECKTKEICKFACKNNLFNYLYMPEEFKNDMDFSLEICKDNPYAIRLVADEFKNNREFLTKFVETLENPFKYANEVLNDNSKTNEEKRLVYKATLDYLETTDFEKQDKYKVKTLRKLNTEELGKFMNSKYEELEEKIKNPFYQANEAFNSSKTNEEKRDIYKKVLNYLEKTNFEDIYGYNLETLRKSNTEDLGKFMVSRYKEIEEKQIEISLEDSYFKKIEIDK